MFNVNRIMAASKGSYRVYLTWTDEMDAALLAVIVEHHNNGDHAQNGWKPHVYNAAIRNVREKCGVEITKDNIASRCKTFDKHYEIISKILSQSGFGWDWENDKLLIDSDDVWNRYVEANKVLNVLKLQLKKFKKHHYIYPKRGSELVRPYFLSLEIWGTSFDDALKSTEPLPLRHVTPPAEILASLQLIPELSTCDLLKVHNKLVLSERLYQALMELPIAFRKEWLLILNVNNGM
ncbi:hypothetical protein HU200_011991 [Digitaria exilis]|uniref:Myb/SANT-like domain-containing protein n=1 Tax=Digitaria exilis TaxID=1010633 RepID=A0A835FH67_9POAL|nr:hypothetical protein HU200_011991 [Digitaria exilis]